MKRIDLTGQTFGRLFVLSYEGKNKYKCECSCINKTIRFISTEHLKSGHTKSCGCLQTDIIRERNYGNTFGRKLKDPKLASARAVWKSSYEDGNLSFEHFLELSQKPCVYCDNTLSNCNNNYMTKDNKIKANVVISWAELANFEYNGLDKIDPTQKHNKNNVVPCCYICNTAKSNMSLNEFKIWLTNVFNNFANKDINK